MIGGGAGFFVCAGARDATQTSTKAVRISRIVSLAIMATVYLQTLIVRTFEVICERRSKVLCDAVSDD